MLLTPEQQLKITMPDGGFIQLIDIMGSDAEIEQAARTSYGGGTRAVSDTTKLLRRLIRDRHTSPFEMAEAKFLIEMDMMSWRQMVRHRTANISEVSGRYSIVPDNAMRATEWRLQAKDNKQGSSGTLEQYPDGMEPLFELLGEIEIGDGGTLQNRRLIPPGQYLSDREEACQALAREVYEERLTFGVAREQARKDLPLSTMTRAYWKCDIHNIMHFLGLRMAPDAQLEIRQYADAMFQLLQPHFPIVMEAFLDYRLNSRAFSANQLRIVKELLKAAGITPDAIAEAAHALVPESPKFTAMELKELITNLSLE